VTERLDLTLPRLAQALRDSGVKVGTGSVLFASEALGLVDLSRRDDVRDALRSVLICDQADFALFDQLFALLFPRPLQSQASSLPALPRSQEIPPVPGGRRMAAALPARIARAQEPRELHELHAPGSASEDEVLKHKDFEQMSRDELRLAQGLLRRKPPNDALRPTRRFVYAERGPQLDLRRMLRGTRRGFDAIMPLRRTPRRRPRDWVMLIDISGSMAAYSRMALHLAHALTRRSHRIETFVFATRLTRITRAMRSADPDAALQAATRAVTDWDGGTRIGDCVAEFNHRWARRVLTRAPWLILMTDGLERASPENLAVEAARLARSCRELIWVNPLRRSPHYQPLAAGAAVLDSCATRKLSAHSVGSLLELARLIA